jgi:hypothetical protein
MTDRSDRSARGNSFNNEEEIWIKLIIIKLELEMFVII